MSLRPIKNLQHGKKKTTSNTHYILHNQPCVMSLSENDGISGNLFYYIHIFSSIIAIRFSTGMLLLCMLLRWKLQSIQTATQNSEKAATSKAQQKTGKICISRMYLTKFSSSKMEVKFISAHLYVCMLAHTDIHTDMNISDTFNVK